MENNLLEDELDLFCKEFEDEYAIELDSAGHEEEDENYMQTLSNINYDQYETQQPILVSLLFSSLIEF